MFQIRNIDGSVTPIPKGAFVELVGPGGKLGGVWYDIVGGPSAHITPGSDDARRYAQMFDNVEFVPVTPLEK